MFFVNFQAREIAPLQPGSLMAEPYSWKSLVTGQPCLRIHTTAIRSAFLNLQPGRHVLKFSVTAPVGHHIHIASNTCFSFGHEEEIMAKLRDESCRFVDQALHIVKTLAEAIKNFSDGERQRESIELLYISMSPITDDILNDTSDGTTGATSFRLTKRKLHEVYKYNYKSHIVNFFFKSSIKYQDLSKLVV